MIIVKLYLMNTAMQAGAIGFIFLLVFVSLFFEKRRLEKEDES